MKRAYGFTIVELLIVIVVIGILAAISIVAYNNVSNKAHDSAVANDAATIAKKLEIAKIDLGHYPATQSQFPDDLKIDRGAYSTGVNNFMYCLNKVTDRYALGLVSKSGKGWLVVSGEVIERTNATSTTVVCGAVGAAWANDADNQAVHGYNANNSTWFPGWITK